MAAKGAVLRARLDAVVWADATDAASHFLGFHRLAPVQVFAQGAPLPCPRAPRAPRAHSSRTTHTYERTNITHTTTYMSGSDLHALHYRERPGLQLEVY